MPCPGLWPTPVVSLGPLSSELAEGSVLRERKGQPPWFESLLPRSSSCSRRRRLPRPTASGWRSIVGMGEYQHLSSLPNPVPDAKAIAAALKAHGFEVFEHYDSTAPICSTRWRRSSRRAGADGGAHLLCRPRHGGRRQERDRADRHGGELREQAGAPLGRAADKLFEALGAAPQQIVLLDACRNNPFPQCPTRGAGLGQRLSRLLASRRGRPLAADRQCHAVRPAGRRRRRRRPFALRQARCSRISRSNPKAHCATCSTRPRRDVQHGLAAAAQVPEITTRGGSPKVCLDADGCGGGGPALAAGAVLNDPADDRRGARALAAARLHGRCDRGGDNALRRCHQAASRPRAGLAPDGQLTPTLLAVLRATETQVAALPTPPRAWRRCRVGAGPLEHEVGDDLQGLRELPGHGGGAGGRLHDGRAQARTATSRPRSRSTR